MTQITNVYPAITNGGARFTGPAADGTDGQVLLTDGNGQLSFGDVASGGGVAILATVIGGLTASTIEDSDTVIGGLGSGDLA